MKLLLLIIASISLSCGKRGSSGADPFTEEDDYFTENVCLSDCSTPKELSYSFSKSHGVAQDGCEIKEFQFMTLDAGFKLVYHAECLDGSQVYQMDLDSNAVPTSDPLMLSSECHDYFFDVEVFAASFSGNEMALVYSCRESYSRSVSYTKVMTKDGVVTGPSLLEESTNSSYLNDKYNYMIEWNETVGVFGIVRKGNFWRLNKANEVLGAVVAIASKEFPYQLKAVDDHWQIFSKGKYYSNSTYCSKVSSVGIPQCNDKKLELSSALALSGSTLLSQDTFSDEIKMSKFNSGTCAASEALSIGSLNDGSIDVMWEPLALSNGYVMVPYTVAGVVKVFFYEDDLETSLLAEVSVGNGVGVDWVSALDLGDRILVAWLGDGNVVMSFSDAE